MNHAQPRNYLVPLFAGTMFVSAGLLFVVQPLVGKVLLPFLGGTAAVWNTCMVFYQGALFVGYLYAHLLSRLAITRQIQIHILLIIASLFVLPIGWQSIAEPSVTSPILWLFGVLTISIGLPFLLLATTSPLLQKWFWHASHADPYYLYAASNAGSMLALLSYPFIIEPNIGLAAQSQFWSILYIALCVLLAICAVVLWQNRTASVANTPTSSPSNKNKLRWLALAAVPASLLLGVSNFISTDITAMPLLWILPLALYLLSFILVFSRWGAKIHPFMLAGQVIVLPLFLVFSFIDQAALPFLPNLVLHLLAFFLAAMVCHGELAKSRPPAEHLTSFYLIISLAGMLGGAFNGLLSPMIFNAVYEYPLLIVASLLLRPYQKTLTLGQIAMAVALLLVGVAGYFLLGNSTPTIIYSATNVLILLAGFSFALRYQTHLLAGITAAILLLAYSMQQTISGTIYKQRSFFGVSSVRRAITPDDKAQKYHELFHGTTKHGVQLLALDKQRTPLAYYSKLSPIGQLFAAFDDDNASWDIASVGLGAGALACYGKENQRWIFYEIDPLVVQIARSKYFSYLKNCAPNAQIVLGDARLSIAKIDRKLDLLIVDAFSSDVVPTHLLTADAILLYFAKLKTDGMVAFHISNRHFYIKKVLATHAENIRLGGLAQEFIPSSDNVLIYASDWLVLSKNANKLARLKASGNWQKLPRYFATKTWTDDFSDILSIWK